MTFKRNNCGRYISSIDDNFYIRKNRYGSYEVFYGMEYIGSSLNLKGIKERFKDTNSDGLQMFLGQFLMDKTRRTDLIGRFGYDFTRFNI